MNDIIWKKIILEGKIEYAANSEALLRLVKGCDEFMKIVKKEADKFEDVSHDKHTYSLLLAHNGMEALKDKIKRIMYHS